MKHALRIPGPTIAAITLIALLTVIAPVAAEKPGIAPAPADTDIPAECLNGAENPALETPEAAPQFGACSESGTEVYICVDSDDLCGGCSNGHCAFLAYESYLGFGSHYRSCYPEITKCTHRCTIGLPCHELCAH